MADNDSSAARSIGWLLGLEGEPGPLTQHEIEERLKVANDMVWRELNGDAVACALEPELAGPRHGSR